MVDAKENYKFDLRVIGLKGSVKGDGCLFALVLNNTGEIGWPVKYEIQGIFYRDVSISVSCIQRFCISYCQ